MELKNAVAVCLISLFSATLVMLIARSLDSQAASRLEPQLARIVEELEAIRSGGGITASSAATAKDQSLRDGLVVYYFHGNTRCPTCEAIESQAHETVQADFAEQLESGEVVWKMLNYEESAASELATKFEIQMPVVVLARMKDGADRRLESPGPSLGACGRQACICRVHRERDSRHARTRQAKSLRQPSPPTLLRRSDSGSEGVDLLVPTGPVEIPLPE